VSNSRSQDLTPSYEEIPPLTPRQGTNSPTAGSLSNLPTSPAAQARELLAQTRSRGTHPPRSGEDRSSPLDKLPKELWPMIFDHLDLNAAINFSQTSNGNYERITDDYVAFHYAATLQHLRHVDTATPQHPRHVDLVLGGSF
jgi:hypothetical protein